MSQDFYSKRNQVYLDLEGNRVVKLFTRKESYKWEEKIYKVLSETGFDEKPHLLDKDPEKGVLFLSYLKGKTLLDLVEVYELESNIEATVVLLIELKAWFEKFYQALDNSCLFYQGESYCFGDVNLRNFIYDKKIQGLDFESVAEGDRNQEWLELLARFLLYRPEKTDYKYKVLKSLYNQLDIKDKSYEQWLKTIEEHITVILEKRSRYHDLVISPEL